MNNIAIIPARGGSKRIPRKNIKDFLGKPIIAYSIENAIKSNLFKEVMVSTDDTEIAEIAKKYGAKVPFIRSKKNSTDSSTTVDVLLEVLDFYKEFKYGCCIYPTAPFCNTQLLQLAYNKIINGNFDSVFPVVKYGHPIQRAFKFQKENIIVKFPENIHVRTQDFEDLYHDAGQFYFFNIRKLIHNKKLFTENTSAIILDELKVQDIDSESDWLLAELKYNLINRI